MKVEVVPALVAAKARAKELRLLHPNLSHCHCLELVAREHGFKSYASFSIHHRREFIYDL